MINRHLYLIVRGIFIKMNNCKSKCVFIYQVISRLKTQDTTMDPPVLHYTYVCRISNNNKPSTRLEISS